uniref:Ubiquitin-conjugating enzyme E2 E3 n=1 Tax=Sciurus vulgaris TaxID=55149 RepID=A0A8D2DYF0_SCIVU
MSSDRQRSDDESPSTSSGSSDADQRDPAAPEPEEQEERKPAATQQKKNTKLSSKTTAKLSTSAKRIQKKLAEITLDPPPNCSAGLLSARESITATSTVRESSVWTSLKTTGVLL